MPEKWAYGKNITYEEFIKKTGNPGYNAYRRYMYHGLANPASGSNITPKSRTYTKPGQYRKLAQRDAKATGTKIEDYNVPKPKSRVKPVQSQVAPLNVVKSRPQRKRSQLSTRDIVASQLPSRRQSASRTPRRINVKLRPFKFKTEFPDLKKLLKGL